MAEIVRINDLPLQFMSSKLNKYSMTKHYFKITIPIKELYGKNIDLISVNNKIWKSSDNVTYMMTLDLINPSITLVQFNTYFCDIEFRQNKSKNAIKYYEGILVKIDETKTIEPEKRGDDLFS